MSTYDLAATPLPAFTGFANLRADFATWRRRRAAYVKTFNELSVLDDRDLVDLGLSRADFHYLASKAAAEV